MDCRLGPISDGGIVGGQRRPLNVARDDRGRADVELGGLGAGAGGRHLVAAAGNVIGGGEPGRVGCVGAIRFVALSAQATQKSSLQRQRL